MFKFLTAKLKSIFQRGKYYYGSGEKGTKWEYRICSQFKCHKKLSSKHIFCTIVTKTASCLYEFLCEVGRNNCMDTICSHVDTYSTPQYCIGCCACIWHSCVTLSELVTSCIFLRKCNGIDANAISVPAKLIPCP